MLTTLVAKTMSSRRPLRCSHRPMVSSAMPNPPAPRQIRRGLSVAIDVMMWLDCIAGRSGPRIPLRGEYVVDSVPLL